MIYGIGAVIFAGFAVAVYLMIRQSGKDAANVVIERRVNDAAVRIAKGRADSPNTAGELKSRLRDGGKL